MRHICFVVQRYGREIVGGAEALCMQYAHELKQYYHVEVVTSCALDYDTWENHYPEGVTRIDGIPVHRYASRHPRRLEKIGPLTEAVYGNPHNSMRLGRKWLKEVGPYCPGIIRHIRRSKKSVDLFIFVGYHYYNSTFGMPYAREKAVFLPTAHDEPPIKKCNYFQYLFSLPRAFVFLTPEEQDFVTGFFHIAADVPRVVAGAWVDIPPEREEPQVRGDYIAYAGRIDQTKNADVLLRHFAAYKQHTPGGLKLVLMGKAHMQLPQREDIVYTGYVSESQKYELLRHARAFVMPSENESLSMGVLEAMACGVPVLVNGNSSVLRAHIERSGAGLCYTDEASFAAGLDALPRDGSMGERGVRYVSENYAKQEIMGKLRGLLDSL